MNIPPFCPRERDREPADRLSQAGAERTAREIIHVWRCHGYQTVKAWAEPLMPAEYKHASGKGGGKVWGVKTNLVNGLPPR